jgi:hypothetical protein
LCPLTQSVLPAVGRPLRASDLFWWRTMRQYQSNYTRSGRRGRGRSGTVNALYWSSEWKALRLQALQRANGRCENCGWDVSGRGQAHADHIEDVKSRPDLVLELSTSASCVGAATTPATTARMGRGPIASRSRAVTYMECRSILSIRGMSSCGTVPLPKTRGGG